MSHAVCVTHLRAELNILECCFLICFYNIVQLTGRFQPFDFIFVSYSVGETGFCDFENAV